VSNQAIVEAVAKTRKIQVTFDEESFERLSEMARREGKKLAGIVREAAEKYALGPESERSKREALEALLSLPSVPAPAEYRAWKREYGAKKSKTSAKKKP
jgi:predicted DNA-binding protein